MAMDKTSLKTRIENEFVALGAVKEGQYSWVSELAEAIANAVIDEITTNATADLTDGSIS